jgi:hypothetical protein
VHRWRIGIAHPVFVSGDRTAMAHVFGLGAKFYTAFKDGTLVVTKSFKDRLPETPQVMKKGGSGSISAAWTDHQEQVRRLVAAGKSIDEQTSFEHYMSMLDKG